MILNLLGLLLVVTVGFVSVVQSEPLMGAVPAQIREFPYVVSIRKNGVHWCGGAIIESNYILSAAHCFVNLTRSDFEHLTIVTGTNFLDGTGQSHRVANVMKYPHYGEGHIWINDIAVVKLKDNIVFNSAQQRIERATVSPPVGSYAIMAGWGSTVGPEFKTLPMELRKLALKVIATNECQRYHGGVIMNDMICTLNQEGVGLCRGDSGSPLVYGGKVVGVVSGGIACAKNSPDIFMDVPSYEPFIRLALATM